MVIPHKAIAAAKEAMREVTPPPGVSKADWLAEHGSFALIAGAIAAAAPYLYRPSADWRRILLRQCQECPKLVPAAQECCKCHE